MVYFKSADAEFEEFSLGSDGMFALPLSISEDGCGNVCVTSYAITENIAKSFGEKFGNDPFSADAKDTLIKMLSPIMEKYGYWTSEETGDTLLEYRKSEICASPKTEAETVILKTNAEIERYPADTTVWNLEVDDEDPHDVICAVIENGRIAAFAAANDLADGMCEVNVECAPAYRRRGYGSACAMGFAEYILSETDTECVSYVCREKNTASRKTAESAGYTLCGRSANFVFYR